jgi:hypothetical protein
MPPKDKETVDITAGSEKIKDDVKKKKKGGGKKSSDEIDQMDTLSEEDKELKERLETCVSTVINKEKEEAVTVPLRLKALDVIVTELRTATSSMTSVPKPLKFLRPHFAVLKELFTETEKAEYSKDTNSLELRARLADVLAVLAMTMGKPEGEWLPHCLAADDYKPWIFGSYGLLISVTTFSLLFVTKNERVSNSSLLVLRITRHSLPQESNQRMKTISVAGDTSLSAVWRVKLGKSTVLVC